MYLKAYVQNLVKMAQWFLRKASSNFHKKSLGQSQEMTLTLKTHIPSLSTFRSQAAIVSVNHFPTGKPKLQNLTLPYINQSKPRVIIWANSNYDGQESQMLHTTFRGNRSAGSGEEDFWMDFTIYGHGGNLGHVTSIMVINILSFYLTDNIQNLIKNGPVVSAKNKF